MGEIMKKKILALAAPLALLFATEANASYTYVLDTGAFGSVSFTLDDLVAHDSGLWRYQPDGELDTCTLLNCGSAASAFGINNYAGQTFGDMAGVYMDQYFYFEDYAFSSTGTKIAIPDEENGHLAATLTITENVPSPTPEPAAWAMMLAGFGAVGTVMRRRKVAVRFA